MNRPSGLGSAAVGRLLLLVTAIGWGFGWPAMKIALQDWPPLVARGTAGMAGALLLGTIALLLGQRLLPNPASLGRLTFAAFTNVFAWMGFTALSLIWLNVAEAALLTYSMPIWATLLAWPLLGQRPGARSFLALCLGIAGLLLLMAPELAGGTDKLPGAGLALAASVLFALGAVTNRRPAALPALALTAWLTGLGSLVMFAIGWALESPTPGSLTISGATAIAFMALVPMALCYLAWGAALRRTLVATASIALLLVPIIGAVSAALMLGEPLGLREISAFALTLGGVGLELRYGSARSG